MRDEITAETGAGVLGDHPRAKRCYEQVTAYENNPLAPEAQEALARLERPVAVFAEIGVFRDAERHVASGQRR